MRRETGVQGDLVVTWAEMPRSPGHAFYDRLQKLLIGAGFDAFVEEALLRAAHGRAVASSGPLFSMHMVGYFEGLDSKRGIVWRCSDSYSPQDFPRLANRDKVPDHSWLSKMRSTRALSRRRATSP
jgi:transposase